VPVGICSNRTISAGNRTLVNENELIGDIKDPASPHFGIDFFDLLRDFIKNELKYKRYDDLQIVFPELPRSYKLFLASVFGILSREGQQIVNDHFLHYPGLSIVSPTLNSFTELLKTKIFFPRRLTNWALDERPTREAQLYICDATSTQDIIDYWNLRAAGYYVFPIPIQAAETEHIKKLARDFIVDSYRPYRHNPSIFHEATVQRSRTLSEDTVKKFCESLNIPKTEGERKPRFVFRMWYPRIWDAWARENAFEGITFPYSHEYEYRISEGESTIELRSQDPKFDILSEHSGKPRFANEFNFQFYGSKEPMAEVFPEGNRELSSAIGRVLYRNWRFSKRGPVFLAKNEKDLMYFDIPLAQSVMTAWFKEQGWRVSLSGPGRLAKQLLIQLGGTHGSSLLAHRGTIELLAKLEKESGMPRQAVYSKLQHIIDSEGLFFNADHFLSRLIETNALRLGGKIQCPICIRSNWYELNALEYKLRCRFCLSSFTPPLSSPKHIVWSYRSHGPFASSNAQGAFTVLLTLRFLRSGHDRGITPLFSYVAKKEGKCLEADLTCLYRPSTLRESSTHVVHAECKSFNRFESKDLTRMKILAGAFPGSALIFATLNDNFLAAEIKLFRALALVERKKKLRGKPHSPVILLTGNELFSSPLTPRKNESEASRRLRERRFELSKLPELADFTQQLYLNLPSWYDWAEKEWKKKKEKSKRSRIIPTKA